MIGTTLYSVCIMLLYAGCTHPGNTPNLAGYSCAVCLAMFLPLSFGIYLLAADVTRTADVYARVAFMFFLFPLSCALIICVFRTSVTERWYTTVTAMLVFNIVLCN
jgi:hypothetical protein